MTFEEHVPLAPYTSFRIGGKARYFCRVTSEPEVREALAFAAARGVPFFVMGGGSNLLVGESGFPGLVIVIGLRGVVETIGGDYVTLEVGAGEPWDDLVSLCVEKGYWGMENLSLIPGTVGAAPVQNIGAYGTEVSETVVAVKVIDSVTGDSITLSAPQCLFGYRDSVFKRPEGKALVITAVIFRLSLSPRPNLSYKDLREYFLTRGIEHPSLRDIREATMSIRRSKFPDLSISGTAGSFWKNPVVSSQVFDSLKKAYPLIPFYPSGSEVKIPLAWILDIVCGLKGHASGPVSLFKNQPLVLTAEFGATAHQVDSFAREIESIVKEKTGIIIEREVNGLLC